MVTLKAKNGFTLIEFLLYIVIVGVILVVVGGIGLNILLGKAKQGALEEVSQNARFVMENITSAVRGAQSVNSPARGFSSSTLSLAMASSSVNPTIFDLSGGMARIKEGLGAFVSLTSGEVLVTDLQFSNVSYPGAPGAVRIQVTVRQVNPDNRPEYNFEETFYTTASVRNR